MLREISQISNQNLLHLILYLESRMNEDNFSSTEVGTLKHDNGVGSTFYEPYNKLFKSIAIVRSKGKVTGISLIGDFRLSISDIIKQFGNYREHHSLRDKMFFYFFNEDVKKPVITIRSSDALTIDDEVKIIDFDWF